MNITPTTMFPLSGQQKLILVIVDCALAGYDFWIDGSANRGYLRCISSSSNRATSLLLEWRGYPGTFKFDKASKIGTDRNHYVAVDSIIKGIKEIWPYVTWATNKNPTKTTKEEDQYI